MPVSVHSAKCMANNAQGTCFTQSSLKLIHFLIIGTRVLQPQQLLLLVECHRGRHTKRYKLRSTCIHLSISQMDPLYLWHILQGYHNCFPAHHGCFPWSSTLQGYKWLNGMLVKVELNALILCALQRQLANEKSGHYSRRKT